ncbi:hypothetical protein GE09DRAFT_1229546 [Coniochaeta sp. 2T2.1]|nr:hypothetical protein GE09DRAFT_1229546 [Coniochaeta sp. 2T2.1]
MSELFCVSSITAPWRRRDVSAAALTKSWWRNVTAAAARCSSNSNSSTLATAEGLAACFFVTLPNLITIWMSTPVRNIGTFVKGAAGDALPADANLDALPRGPTALQREASPFYEAVTVTAADGSVRRAVLHTVNGYTYRPMASVEAARRVRAGGGRRSLVVALWRPSPALG